MWLFTTVGFFSVVELRESKSELMVRARVMKDLDELREKYMAKLGPTLETPKADYRYRAIITRREFKRGLACVIDDLDYPNFKDEVADRQGRERSALYHEVWSVMAGAERVLEDASGRRRKRDPSEKK